VPVERINSTERMVKAGVRPEKIRVEHDGDASEDGWNSIAGTLRVTTFIGVSHQYTVDLPTGRTMTAFAQNLGNENPPKQGDRVRLVWRPEHTFVVAPSEPLADWEEDT
jgi:spermidine/putrescine transport system ATP-binding protein